uniref:GP-PDE domain-containing protein n=1 Tax=Scylla olivacea TaxID=85551 RepID=A0A0P4W2L2_SCYOL
MRDPSQITAAMEHNLIVFCWGDHNNDQENIKFLKKVGLHGIIYDKIDVYNTKDKKESIFLCEERAAADELVRGEEEKKKEEEEEVAAAAAANLAPSAARVMQGGGGERSAYTGVCPLPTSFTGILSN